MMQQMQGVCSGFQPEDNSQTFSNSDPTLGNGNSTSMKELTPLQGESLEERRQKKRQRKQDKTKKMQSKLTYMPMTCQLSQVSNAIQSELPTLVPSILSPIATESVKGKARLEVQEIQNSDQDSATQLEVEALRLQLAECKT